MSETSPLVTQRVLLNAVHQTGSGLTYNAKDFRDIGLMLSGDDTCDVVVKIQGSFQETEPDFDLDPGVSNHWTYIATYDLAAPETPIDGATGVTINSGAEETNCKSLLVNVDHMNWINVRVTTYNAGHVTAVANGFKAY